jgi:pyruvate formate lyase activating enzyme
MVSGPSAAAQEATGGPGPRPSTPQGPAAPAAVPSRPGGAEGLRIGGLTPLTTVDCPGELAAVVFCQGCPWRCRYCHNAHLVPARGDDLIPWREVRAFLARRRGLIDTVVFSGGEPTVQAALPAAMAEVRALGFRAGLHTGGPSPQRLGRLLPLIDWVGLDIKALPERYPEVTGVPGSGARAWTSLGLVLDSGIDHEVRTTLMPRWTLEGDLIPLMDRLAARGVRHFAVQIPGPGPSLDPHLDWRSPLPPREAIARAGAARFPDFLVR